MAGESDDPTVVSTIVVNAEDVVSAVESVRRGGGETVLRITPPFSGRMRARIHVPVAGEYEGTEPEPIHVHPTDLLADDAPDYPTPADTEDELRADPDTTYSRERHRDYHAERVAEWRERITDHFAETATLDTPAGSHEVAVAVLGDPGD
jgi:hypothetical protein